MVVGKLSRLSEIFLAGFSYICLHELGHYIFALLFGLSPQLVTSPQTMPMTGFALTSVGVAYSSSANIFQSYIIVLGAVLLPFFVAIIFLIRAKIDNNLLLVRLAKMYIVFILLNMVPIAGQPNLDANKIWAFTGLV
jgi:hypothetical protein